MYKVGGFLFTFHGAGSGESLLSDKEKKFPVSQRAANIMSQNFPTALERYTCSRSQSPVLQ